jgi:signal transduction histidine kinase/DNA-binding response OmpR family regulator
MLIWNQLDRSLNTSIEAERFGETLGRLYSALQEAESSQRGFLLSGDDAYLQPFAQAESVLPKAFDKLLDLSLHDPILKQDVLQLRGLTEVKMVDLRDAIKRRRETGFSTAQDTAISGKGKETMDAIRKVVSRLNQDGSNMLAGAAQVTRRQMQLGQRTGVFTGFLGIGAGLLALYLVRVGSKQEKAAQSLLKEKVRAERIVREKSAFLANVSHEIRTPMNAILGFGELLENEPLTSRQAQYVRCLHQSGKSLLQLINDVLDLSKLEAGKLEPFLEPTDLTEVLGFVQTMFAHQAMVKSIELKLESPPLPQALLLDRLRLRQVLVNLVGNAVKFTEHGFVQVHVDWSQQDGDRSRGILAINVADTGIGISPEKQREIFEPFVQSNPRQNGENQGTGLGLTIVQRLTELIGGTVTLESTLGQGATFHLLFPDVQISARLPVTDTGEADGSVDFNDFAPATVLVVDDNETNRALIAGIFEGTHHQLRLASDGREALESIQQAKPDIVLLDIRMPVLDGRATLAELRKLPGLDLLPVIAVTASSQVGDESGLRRHFNGYIRKPFSRRELYKELAQFLPRAARPAGQIASAPAEPAAPAQSPALPIPTGPHNWEHLAAHLRQLQSERWSVLCETLAINDTQAFARTLRDLANGTQCGPLADYADVLAANAEAFAVHDLEQRLAEFPAVILTIESKSSPEPVASAHANV